MISIVLPHWPIAPELEGYLDRCVKSLSGYDELVLVVNDGIGFAKAVNRGMKLAKGDYIAVVSNDIVWEEGNLGDLCIPGKVTSVLLNGTRNPKNMWGCFFVVPRDVLEKVGYLDEQFGLAYYEDDDYIKRINAAGIEIKCVDSCAISSEGGRTMRLVDDRTRSEINVRNKVLFDSKWANK